MQHYIKIINTAISKKDLVEALNLVNEALLKNDNAKIYIRKKEEIERKILLNNINNNSNYSQIILVLSERFLPRFGVDRVSIKIADIFSSIGYRVVLVGQAFDELVLSKYECINVPTYSNENHVNSDYFVSNYVKNELLNKFLPFKIVGAFSAGWPFIQSNKHFLKQNIPIYYVDYGINPPKDGDIGQKITLGILADLKKIYLPYATMVLPISSFIARSQTAKIVSQSNITTILLGSDHIAQSVKHIPPPRLTEDVKKQFEIFLLGRYETGNYKQAEKIWDLFDQLKEYSHNPKIKVLAREEELPEKYRKDCLILGYIDDKELAQQIIDSDITVCLSTWEGFNLPLAESQRLFKPCFVLNTGAHPEVVADPYLLCDSLASMSRKIHEYQSNSEIRMRMQESLKIWQNKFTWAEFAYKYETIVNDFSSRANKFPKIMYRQIILLPVTNSLVDPANSGVVRVTRKIASEISRDPRFELHLIRFKAETCTYELVNKDDDFKFFSEYSCEVEATTINRNKLPQTNSHSRPCVLMCEIPNEREQVEIEWFSKVNNYMLSCIFHDAIPYTHPEFVADKRYVNRHFEYMNSISKYELIISVSNSSKKILEDIYKNFSISFNRMATIYWGADLIYTNALINSKTHSDKYVLFVSTLEPRKNHIKFVSAFIKYKVNNPDSCLCLKLVGNRYLGSDDIYDYIKEMENNYDYIKYLGVVSDAELDRLYRDCSFVAYPSLVEGFGLPIVESAAYNKLCITTDDGVLREIGCITNNCCFVDTNSVEAITNQLAVLDHSINELSERYIEEYGDKNKFRDWSEYLDDLLNCLVVSSNFYKDEC